MTKKRVLSILIILFALLITINFVNAQEQSQVAILIFKNIKNNEKLSSIVVTLKINDRVINQFLDKDGILAVKLGNGSYLAEFKLDNQSTEGMDYYFNGNINLENNKVNEIFVYPVGSVRGLVKDNLDNVVGNAKLKFECSASDILNPPKESDDFGSFSIDYMPVGSCRIYANYRHGNGFADIIIAPGSLNNAEIKLDKSIVFQETNLWLISGVTVIILILLFALKNKIGNLLKNSTIKHSKNNKSSEIKSTLKLEKRAIDIMETLTDKQKEIVKFIFENEGKTTQSKIYNELGIPKASLFRYIQSLELKKIIEVKKIGKVKKIKLTDWFVGKE